LVIDADEYSVTRSLEAYLMWLFGYIMFNNSHGHCVDRVLVPYAQEIADADEDAIPLYSWGTARVELFGRKDRNFGDFFRFR